MKPTRFPTSTVRAKQSSDQSIRNYKRPRSSEPASDDKDLTEELDDLLTAAKDRFAEASDAWAKQRRQAIEDLKFYKGDQWSEALRSVARTKSEPTITVNRLPQFVKQVENELRSQQISISVFATDEAGSEATADIFAGIIRGIERASYAPSQYIHAAGEAGAMVPGFGFLKLETVFAEAGGFNQEIRIASPPDPFKILPDPNALQPDSSDAQYWFEFDDYSKEAYKRLFPDSELSTMDLESPGSGMSQWVGDAGVRVVKYWYKEEAEAIEYLLEDGTSVNSLGWYDPNADEDEQDDERLPFPTKPGAAPDAAPEKKAILRTRTIVDTRIKWVTMNGCEILDQGEWGTSEFPFVSIYGPSLIVDGERDIHGIVRHAKDSQQMLNYMASSAVRRIGSANKAPWIADAKSIVGYEQFWKTANTENWAVLPYNSVDPDNPGKPLPPPQRADQTGQITDLLAGAQKFENDLKSCLGIYDAGLGATPNEQSGVAIRTLAEQGKNANFHFSDALTRGIQRLGHLLLQLIPKIYDTPRVLRIIGPDTTEKLVKINQLFQADGGPQQYDLSAGNYGCAVDAGPAYATRKQQALDSIVKLCGADPALLPVIQDILVGEMDFDGAPIIQQRLKKLLAQTNPNLIEDDVGNTPIPPQAQAKMGQMQQALSTLTQQMQGLQMQNHQLMVEKATKEVEHQQQLQLVQAKLEAELQIEQARTQRDLAAASAKAQTDAISSNARLEAQQQHEFLQHTHDTQKLVLDHHAKTLPPAPKF